MSLHRVFEILADINKHQTIPAVHRDILEERLVIACKPVVRQRRMEGRPRRDIRSHFRQKKAHQVYLNVLDKDPGAFLPFLLGISPKVCETFDISSFNVQKSSIHLGDDAKLLLEDIAKRREINQSPHYKRLIELLFPGSYIIIFITFPSDYQASFSSTRADYHCGKQ